MIQRRVWDILHHVWGGFLKECNFYYEFNALKLILFQFTKLILNNKGIGLYLKTEKKAVGF